jgi:hypothetical protein
MAYHRDQRCNYPLKIKSSPKIKILPLFVLKGQLIEEGTKILHVPNPVDPLKACNGERSVQ